MHTSVKVFVLRGKMFSCSLEPEWAAAATEVKEQTKGKVKLAAVDATLNQMLASRYGVSMFTRLFVKHIDFSAVTSSSTPGLPVK